MIDLTHVLDATASWLPSPEQTVFWLFVIVVGFGISKLSTALTTLVMGEDNEADDDDEEDDTPEPNSTLD